MRLVGALGMALVGWLADSAVLVAVASMQILYQACPFARLALLPAARAEDEADAAG